MVLLKFFKNKCAPVVVLALAVQLMACGGGPAEPPPAVVVFKDELHAQQVLRLRGVHEAASVRLPVARDVARDAGAPLLIFFLGVAVLLGQVCPRLGVLHPLP